VGVVETLPVFQHPISERIMTQFFMCGVWCRVHEAAQQRRGEAVTELTIFGCLARKQVVRTHSQASIYSIRMCT
jgi:hypothetical protein